MIFYTRQGCHLCEETLELLRKHESVFPISFRVVDVDDDPELARKYGEMVPVIEVEGRARLWGKISEALILRLLRAEAGT